MAGGFAPRRAVAALAPLLTLAAAGCGDDDNIPNAPETGGVPADALSEPVYTIGLARFVTRTIVPDGEESGRFDASWSYAAADHSWNRTDSGRLESEEGPGALAIDEGRGCPE